MNNTLKQYLHERDAVIRAFEQLSITSTVAWYRRFAYFSANLGLFNPQIPVGEYIPLFRKAMANQHLSFLDQRFFAVVPPKMDRHTETIIQSLNKQPAVICTFHTGSYRLIGQLLIKLGIPFSLLVAEDALQRHDAAFQQTFQQWDQTGGSHLHTINAENQLAGMHMLRSLRSGRSLLAYMDGNTGSGKDARNLVDIRFLASTMRVRKGLPWLAQRAQVPMHTLINRRLQGSRSQLLAGTTFLPRDEAMRQSDFAEQATQTVYDTLAAHVREEPWQWENWLTLHAQWAAEKPAVGA